jgi:hypothetical protein
MTPDKILRNLENGYFMTHQEQDETAKYIRQLQASNEALKDGLLKSAEDLFALRRELIQLRKELDERA